MEGASSFDSAPPPTPRLRTIPLPFLPSPAIPPLIPSNYFINIAPNTACVTAHIQRMLETILFDEADTLVIIRVGNNIQLLWRELLNSRAPLEDANDMFVLANLLHHLTPPGRYRLSIQYDQDKCEWYFFISKVAMKSLMNVHG